MDGCATRARLSDVTTRRVVFGALVVLALVLSLGRFLSERYTDYLWYASLGAADVWRAQLLTTSVLWSASLTAASAFAFVNLYAVRLSVVSLVLPRRIANV